MNETFEFDVFLSHSSKDKKIVHELAKRLKQDGLCVWLDEWEIQPGDLVPLKIQRGLEQSRTLLMCMSPAYFDSEWSTLEHYTLLFRDPTNAQRRFIPLLIEDCSPPDIIAQFAYIDWRTMSAYEKILAVCRKEEPEKAKPLSSMEWAYQEKIVLEGHTDWVFGVAVTPDGKTIVSGSTDDTLKVWDLETGRCQVTFWGHTSTVVGVAITPDGKTIVSGSADGTLKVWDLETGRCRATFEGHTNAVWGVAITSDGKTIVSGSLDKTLKVWDLETGKCRATLEGHSGEVHGVAATSDGKTIVSGSLDKTLKVWDLETGRCRATFEGHTDQVWGVAITSDGKTIVSGSLDKTLKVWDLETGK
jgi:WD40 repeat protein